MCAFWKFVTGDYIKARLGPEPRVCWSFIRVTICFFLMWTCKFFKPVIMTLLLMWKPHAVQHSPPLFTAGETQARRGWITSLGSQGRSVMSNHLQQAWQCASHWDLPFGWNACLVWLRWRVRVRAEREGEKHSHGFYYNVLQLFIISYYC